jgi:hypothetical protein
MAKPNKLRELEQKHGDLHKVIPHLVNEHDQRKAAEILGVSTATISTWLKNNGYLPHIEYVRKSEQHAVMTP